MDRKKWKLEKKMEIEKKMERKNVSRLPKIGIMVPVAKVLVANTPRPAAFSFN